MLVVYKHCTSATVLRFLHKRKVAEPVCGESTVPWRKCNVYYCIYLIMVLMMMMLMMIKINLSLHNNYCAQNKRFIVVITIIIIIITTTTKPGY
jgi:hypothetical protein